MTIIREAVPGDAEAIARVHVTSWRSTYPGLLPDSYLVGMSEGSARQRWRSILSSTHLGRRTLVAVEPGEGVVGFGHCGLRRACSQLDGFDGEFYALYLLDEAQGRGIGRRLMGVMAERLLDIGLQSALVWCLAGNPARWFYERLGGQRVAERPIRFSGSEQKEIAFVWRDLVPLLLDADPKVG